MSRKKQKHLTKDDILAAVDRQTRAVKAEVVTEATDYVTSQVYAAVALAIARYDDGLSNDEKQEYIQEVFDESGKIWAEASKVSTKKGYRAILKELYDDFGIEIMMGGSKWE